jgi:hypothetical protein
MGETRNDYKGLEGKPKRHNFEYPEADERIIFKWAINKHDEGTDSIRLAQEREQFRVLASSRKNLGVPKSVGNFLTY